MDKYFEVWTDSKVSEYDQPNANIRIKAYRQYWIFNEVFTCNQIIYRVVLLSKIIYDFKN